MRRLLVVLFCLSTAVVASGCLNPFWFLPAFHEGPHRIQATTPADTLRAREVVTCLAGWAHGNYADVDVSRLVIVRVGGDGVIGTRSDGATFQTDARENGDTIFINERVSNSEFVGLERHESVHLAQAFHRELVGADGNIHWSPPFTACQVPLAIFR